MKKSRCRYIILCLVLLITLLAGLLPLGPTPFLLGVTAEHREFEVDKFAENITIAPNAFQSIDFNLQEGEEFEVIFTLQVKEELPIDIWFVNQDHYILLTSGSQFLFFIDGSEQEITYTRKIVTLTEHDLYKLVLTNYYSNQTVQVGVICEIRTFLADSDADSLPDSWELDYFGNLNQTENGDPDNDGFTNFQEWETGTNPTVSDKEGKSTEFPWWLILVVIIIILLVILVLLLFKTRSYKQTISKVTKKAPSKKIKKHKGKKAKSKISKKAAPKKAETRRPKHIKPKVIDEEPTEEAEPEVSDEEPSKAPVVPVPKKTEPEVSAGFCGFCGTPVTTPFCTNCGRKVR